MLPRSSCSSHSLQEEAVGGGRWEGGRGRYCKSPVMCVLISHHVVAVTTLHIRAVECVYVEELCSSGMHTWCTHSHPCSLVYKPLLCHSPHDVPYDIPNTFKLSPLCLLLCASCTCTNDCLLHAPYLTCTVRWKNTAPVSRSASPYCGAMAYSAFIEAAENVLGVCHAGMKSGNLLFYNAISQKAHIHVKPCHGLL